MKNRTRAALAAAAIATCLVSTAAPAATCWSQADVSAAKVRELQTRLMVAALRCRATGVNILASYNAFVGNSKPALVAANNALKAHFAAGGPVAGQRDYDRYTTTLANAYGAADTGPESCAEAANLAAEATNAKGDLAAFAAQAIPVATLPSSSACASSEGVVLAAK
jgi:hypothetical protein